MADTILLETPILEKIDTFVLTGTHTFKFLYNTGNKVNITQFTHSRLVIAQCDPYKVVYDKKLNCPAANHIVTDIINNKEQILYPNVTYTAKLQVIYENGPTTVSGNFSDPVIFYCFTEPEFHFSNIQNSDGNKISRADFTLYLSYFQAENEPLLEYGYIVYDYLGVPLYSSDTYYDETNLSHKVVGLKNDSTYYFRAIGTSKHGLALDTGKIKVDVEYILFPSNIALNVSNNYKEGHMLIYSGIRTIGYETQNDSFTFENGEVTLTGNELYYSSGFRLEHDFTIIIKARLLPLDKFFIAKSDTVASDISLEMVEAGGRYYCKLTVGSPINNYVIYRQIPKPELVTALGESLTDNLSNRIVITNLEYNSNELFVFILQRKNNIYNLILTYEGEME